jgi:hypothetical protein
MSLFGLCIQFYLRFDIFLMLCLPAFLTAWGVRWPSFAYPLHTTPIGGAAEPTLTPDSI